MKKTFLVAALLLALLFTGCVSQGQPSASPSATAEPSQAATPTITPNPTSESGLLEINVIINAPPRDYLKTIPVEVAEGASALEASAKAVEIGVKNYSFGAYVFSVDGINESNSEGLYWQFYFNGKLAPVGANDFKLSQKGILEWRLEKPQLGG